MTADFTWLGSLPLSLLITLSENRLDLHPDASPGLAQPKGVFRLSDLVQILVLHLLLGVCPWTRHSIGVCFLTYKIGNTVPTS